jgi:hypothetical protein
MAEQSYQPQINLTALDAEVKQRWLLRMLFIVAVLGAVTVVFVYQNWFRSLVSGGSSEATVSTSETTTEKPAHVRAAKSRRDGAEHHIQAPVIQSEPDTQMTLGSGIVESSMRSPLAVEVVSGGGKHEVIGTRDDAVYLQSHDLQFARKSYGGARYGEWRPRIASGTNRGSPTGKATDDGRGRGTAGANR